MIDLFSFPFQQIGTILRNLSLSGNTGNFFSILLFLIFCSSPLIYYLVRKAKGHLIKADCLLYWISFSFLAGMYLYINPGYLCQITGQDTLSASYLFTVGATIWSIIICYILFRILHRIENRETSDLLFTIRHIITALILFTIIIEIGGQNILSIIADIQTTSAGNTNMFPTEDIFSDSALVTTYGWIFLKHILSCIPSILLLRVLFKSRNIVRTLQTDAYDETAIQQLNKIGISCRTIVIVIAVLAVLQNIIQLIFAQYILTADYIVPIPIYTLLFVFIILLLSKKFSEHRDEKLDNDLFI